MCNFFWLNKKFDYNNLMLFFYELYKNMPEIDLSLIPSMFVDVFKNPVSLRIFGEMLTDIFYKITFNLLWLFIIVAIFYYFYLYYKKFWFKKSNKKESISVLKIWFEKIKRYLYGLRYFLIGILTMFLSKTFIWWVFYYIATSYPSNISIWWLTEQENLLMGYWAFLSLIMFLLPPYFIAFSFGNKFVRNIWILIYILGIAFIFLWGLLNLKNVSYI